MDVRNCMMCGRLFNYMGGTPICEACKGKMENDFQRVKEYIRENPGATIQQIAKDNDVTTHQIKQWVRDERLELTPDSPIQLFCESCGTNIRTGRFCEACKMKFANGLTDAFRDPKPAPQPETKRKLGKDDKMRFIK